MREVCYDTFRQEVWKSVRREALEWVCPQCSVAPGCECRTKSGEIAARTHWRRVRVEMLDALVEGVYSRLEVDRALRDAEDEIGWYKERLREARDAIARKDLILAENRWHDPETGCGPRRPTLCGLTEDGVGMLRDELSRLRELTGGTP